MATEVAKQRPLTNNRVLRHSLIVHPDFGMKRSSRICEIVALATDGIGLETVCNGFDDKHIDEMGLFFWWWHR